MRGEPKSFYQLWCYYETKGEWIMEGLFRSADEAQREQYELYNKLETPCMPDWAIIKVEGWW